MADAGNKKTLLIVLVGGHEVCSIESAPVEKMVSIPIGPDSHELAFTDSAGKTYAHNLESVLKDGCSWLHLSVRVHGSFACQSDCLISDSKDDPVHQFQAGRVKGIRFQPFLLPERGPAADRSVGHGLFHRGFHFTGVVTPGNVSLSCICDYCSESFRLQSFHAGFGDDAYFYCSGGPHTLVTNGYRDTHVSYQPPSIGTPDWSKLAELEEKLPQCRICGGDFRYLNSFLCPHCLKPYIDYTKYPKERETDYYGVCIYGESCQTLQTTL